MKNYKKRVIDEGTYKHLNDPIISELNTADALCENDPRHYTRAQSLEILKERRDTQPHFCAVPFARGRKTLMLRTQKVHFVPFGFAPRRNAVTSASESLSASST